MSKTAAVFAGQGAQAIGMGKDLAEAYPECRALFEKADAILGYSLSRICFEGPIEELTKSNNCQPAIFLSSVACWTALQKEAPALSVAGVAGLSLGEWTALHVAGAIAFEDAVRVLEARGRFMQQACDEKPGGMVSVIGLPVEKLREVCAAAGVEIANLNSPEQTVLSGEKAAIEEAEKLAKAAGAKRTVILNVAGAFHSALMASAAARLRDLLAGVPFVTPRVPVVANVTGRPHGTADEIRDAMVRQVTGSVRWVDGIQWFKEQGVTRYVECGPGKVLSGLIKRIDTGATSCGAQDVATAKAAAEALRG